MEGQTMEGELLEKMEFQAGARVKITLLIIFFKTLSASQSTYQHMSNEFLLSFSLKFILCSGLGQALNNY